MFWKQESATWRTCEEEKTSTTLTASPDWVLKAKIDDKDRLCCPSILIVAVQALCNYCTNEHIPHDSKCGSEEVGMVVSDVE